MTQRQTAVLDMIAYASPATGLTRCSRRRLGPAMGGTGANLAAAYVATASHRARTQLRASG